MTVMLKVDLHSIRFSSAFIRFCAFVLLHEKYVLFRPHFYMSITNRTRLSHTGQKFLEKKKKFVKEYCILKYRSHCLYEYSKFLKKKFWRKEFEKKILKKNFLKTIFINVTVNFARMWTCYNADEKPHNFSQRSKAVKKTDKQNSTEKLRKKILLQFCSGFQKLFSAKGALIRRKISS